MAVIPIVIGVIFLLVVIRLAAGGLDHDRVDEYISSRGGRMIDRKWNPFGTGWVSAQNDRIYEVRYIDKDGNIHEATCKTSLLGGVYFTQDEIVEYAEKTKHADRETELEIENRRLKQQIEDLKRKKDYEV
jgi:hypothetical protein